ncbi:MAG: translation initiation factor IF-2 [Actinobacteria bacterium RBG_16_68_21]|nr:MAG: translation initiation factor IF-2 [Actinobacteria bacterium RBG_16_68_21]
MRVYELARDLGRESKEVLSRVHELGIDAKTASSGLSDEDAALVRLSYDEESAPAVPVGERPAAEVAATPDAVAGATLEEDEEFDEDEDEDEDEDGGDPKKHAAKAGKRKGRLPGGEGPQPKRPITVTAGITVAEFSDLTRRPVGIVVRELISRGRMAGATQPIPADLLEVIGDALGYEVTVESAPVAPVDEQAPLVRPKKEHHDNAADLKPRPPVVTVMGHVDHGKTQLLDRIRHANVVAGEAGGITQHIGAYQTAVGDRRITFIDTPGHEAFTSLRARGAELTDIVVLVVAGDDGVMPQTVEAINHAKAARVPIVVAINKMDLPGANPGNVRAQLTEHGLVVEQLGGDVVSAEVSALTGDGIDQLLEYIDLIAELEEYTANPDVPASGTVVEGQLEKGRGPVGTLIVQRGTLRRGDAIVAGVVAGRVRAMFDENGRQLEMAPPSAPVLVMGWDEIPQAGDYFEVVADDRVARGIAADRLAAIRNEELTVPTAAQRLSALLEDLRTADDAELVLIFKADAHGSLEAIREAVGKIGREGGRITIAHAAVGGITENDVLLAEATNAVIFGFNVRPDAKTRKAAEEAGIEIRTYRIIYELLDDIEAMLVGRLAPTEVERVLGSAEVRATFRAPRFGFIAGCMVTEGEINRGSRIRLIRDGIVVHDGTIGSLRRFKDDVRSVASGFECGIGLDNFKDVKEGDVIEAFEVREVART